MSTALTAVCDRTNLCWSKVFGLQNGLQRVYNLWIVNENKVSRVGLSSPYGLPKKTPQRVFFCAQTLDITSVSRVFVLEKFVAYRGLRCFRIYLNYRILRNVMLFDFVTYAPQNAPHKVLMKTLIFIHSSLDGRKRIECKALCLLLLQF